MIVDGFETEAVKIDGTTLEGVLVSPAEAESGLVPTDITLPAHAHVRYRLDIPKGYTGRLRGQKVEVRGELYDVADKPAYTPGNTPGAWNRYALAYRLEPDGSDEVEVFLLSTTLDDAGYAQTSEVPVYSGPAQARLESGSAEGGTSLQTDSTETWFFVFPWKDALEGARASQVRVRFRGDVLAVQSVENVDRRGEQASVKAVRRG